MSVITFIQRHSTFSSAVAKVSGLHMSSTLSRLILLVSWWKHLSRLSSQIASSYAEIQLFSVRIECE